MSAATRAFFAATLAFLLAACGFAADTESASRSVSVFHERLNAARFDDILQDATPELASSTGEGDFVKILAAVHRKLGDWRSATQTGVFVKSSMSRTLVVLSYRSHFERGEATETFTLVLSGDNARLLGYNIQSPVLVID